MLPVATFTSRSPKTPQKDERPYHLSPIQRSTHKKLRLQQRFSLFISDHRGIAFTLSILALWTVWWLQDHPLSLPSSSSSPISTTTMHGASQPTFATILPTGKSINQLGGWNRASPENTNPVFAFQDRLNNATIIVSQQPLPENFSSDVDKNITELAKSYNATERLPIAGGIAFVGSSGQGPQSVIASKNNLLILITSTTKHSSDQWVEYLASLH